ncbi:MAG: hypothetical protein ABSE68_02880 [Minisyncoccia bacterium]
MKERSPSESIVEMRQEARERIMSIIEKYGDDPNITINVEKDRETPETILLELKITDPENNEVKTYHKGFMKVLNMPDGLSIEEEVERKIRFPEENHKGD